MTSALGIHGAPKRNISSSRPKRRKTEARAGETLIHGDLAQLEHCVASQQFDRQMLDQLFAVAHQMEHVGPRSEQAEMLRGFVMATLFYEPSTRTRLSFEAAMMRLGGRLISTENASEFSSGAKGESLEDTMRTIESYADVIVMRHSIAGSAKRAAQSLSIPLINAGDGPGQHPTQALLDVYTILREIGRLDGVKVALVGDLANGRTVRSLAFMLSDFKDVKLYFVAPDVVRMADDVKQFLNEKGIAWEETNDLHAVAAEVDVVYQTRIQRERFAENPEDYDKARGQFVVDQNLLQVMSKHSVVLHPLPRLDEITSDVDRDPRAAYFRQAQNGMYIRMALLRILLLNA